MNFKISASILAQWQELVKDAEKATSCSLNEELEHYLVLLLESFTHKTDLTKNIMAIEFLESYHKASLEQQKQLREVADKCLLFSGLFPDFANKQVSINYFIDLGKQSYHLLGSHDRSSLAKLFHALGVHFVSLMDILQAMRELTGNQLSLTPLQAEELWRVTQSKHALTVLRHYTDGIIITDDNLKKKH